MRSLSRSNVFLLRQACCFGVQRSLIKQRCVIESVAEEDKARFFLFGRYVAAGSHLLGPNQEASLALTFVVPHDETCAFMYFTPVFAKE